MSSTVGRATLMRIEILLFGVRDAVGLPWANVLEFGRANDTRAMLSHRGRSRRQVTFVASRNTSGLI